MLMYIETKPKQYKAVKWRGSNHDELIELLGDQGELQQEKRINGKTFIYWNVKPTIQYQVHINEGDVLYIDEAGYLQKRTAEDVKRLFNVVAVKHDFYSKECPCGQSHTGGNEE